MVTPVIGVTPEIELTGAFRDWLEPTGKDETDFRVEEEPQVVASPRLDRSSEERYPPPE